VALSQKIIKLTESLSRTSNYWESVDKYLKRGNLRGEVSQAAATFQEFKAALTSVSACLSKPAELFKGPIQHISTQNRKNLEPITDVTESES
jgi:hypothetical protein